MALFRRCPNCGKRFGVRLLKEEVVERSTDTETIAQGFASSVRGATVVVEDHIPVTIEKKTVESSFKCDHCSHEWSEKRVEEHKT